jgi:hypothetical protein
MDVKEFASRMSDGLEADYWSSIEPRIFKYIGEDVKENEVDEETWESMVSLKAIIEQAIGNKPSPASPIPAICTPMGAITAEDIIAELQLAWKNFGKYTYGDKGADEVMDVGTIARRIRTDYDATGIINLLKEVAKIEDSYELISSIITQYDNDADLMMALEAADRDFLSKYY